MPTTDIVTTEEASLEEKLDTVQGVKREYLLFKMLGISHDTILKLLDTDDMLDHWKKDKNFKAVFKTAGKLSRQHKGEVISLVRQGSRQIAIAIERLLLQRVMKEALTGEYLLLKTHVGRDAYSKSIQGAEQTGQESPGLWEEMILRRKTIPAIEHHEKQETEGEQ